MNNIIIFLIALTFVACTDSDHDHKYTPTSKEMNQTTYKFGIHPYLNSKKMYISYRPLLDYIEAKIGNIKIILETSSSYSDYNTKLYRGDFDISLPNPYQTYKACAKGYTVVARMKPDNVFRGIFVARKDSHITSVNQLKGKSVSFPAPTALAATMMPLLYLKEHGLDINNDISKKYVGSQYSSILNAFTSDTIMGATWPPPWEAWKKENPKKAKQMEVVWQTNSLINNGLIVKNTMDKKTVKELTNILITLDTTIKGKMLLDKAGFEGFQRSSNGDYDIVSDFLVKYNKTIGNSK